MKRWLSILAIISAVTLAVGGARVARRVITRQMETQSWPPPLMNFRAARASYPFSVVPGGVYDWRDVSDSVTRDPVVREHYEDIRVNNLWAGRTQQPSLVYVSYRKGDRVFWTRNKVRIPKGELVLTDGNNVIRARCGNRLRKLPPPLGVSTDPAEDPPELMLETPVPPIVQTPPDGRAVLISQLEVEPPILENPVPPVQPPPPQEPPPTEPPTIPIIPITPPVGPPPITPPIVPPTTPPPTPVTPEPGTFVLLLSGMGLLGGAAWRGRSR